MKFKRAKQILERMLVGHSYSRVGIGDSWDFYFDNGLYLISQEISSPEDSKLKRLLSQAEPSVLDGVDPEYVIQGIIIHRNMRQEITQVNLANDGSLTLTFDQNRSICLTVEADVIDSQWALNKTGGDPYTEFIVGCFWKNEVEIAP